jgi:hypothetical protein
VILTVAVVAKLIPDAVVGALNVTKRFCEAPIPNCT